MELFLDKNMLPYLWGRKIYESHLGQHELYFDIRFEFVIIDDFPEYMRDCIVCDYKGRYYQDFYR